MPDGRRPPTKWVVEIRIESDGQGAKNPGSIIPGNLRVRTNDEITWFVSQRVDPKFPTPVPPEKFTVEAVRRDDVRIFLTFKQNSPFKEKFKFEGEKQITDTVKTVVPQGKELICHYGVVVMDKDKKVILQDTHCPEIIIQSASGT
ncbi:MAG TPA: hypothetical protein VKB92_05620 [Myxococcales bacterium]|nr:hypothetical protein [Myxococcales bacterium]